MSGDNAPLPRVPGDVLALEARTEALEFLMLGLLRGVKDDAERKWPLIDAFELMDRSMRDPELNRSDDHRRLARRAFAEILLVA